MRSTFRSLMPAAVLAAAMLPSQVFAGPTCDPDPGPVFLDNETPCVPTPEECSTGNYNGVYDPGLADGRFGVCFAVEGRVLLYAAGSTFPCGAIFVADHYVVGSYAAEVEDPNRCR